MEECNYYVLALVLVIFLILLILFICCVNDKNTNNDENFKNFGKPGYKSVFHHNITNNYDNELNDLVIKNNLKSDFVNINPRWHPKEVEKYLLDKNLDWMQLNGPLPSHDNIPWDSPNIVFTTLLRKPLERALSDHDVYMDKYPEIKKDKDYKRWIKENPHFTDNYLTRWLVGKWCGYEGCGARGPEKLTDHDLVEAKHKLNKFDILLFEEDLPKGGKKFKELLGFKTWNILKKEEEKPHKKISPKLLKELKEMNKFDLELYKYARNRKS
jgi:hypothetical protein